MAVSPGQAWGVPCLGSAQVASDILAGFQLWQDVGQGHGHSSWLEEGLGGCYPWRDLEGAAHGGTGGYCPWRYWRDLEGAAQGAARFELGL